MDNEEPYEHRNSIRATAFAAHKGFEPPDIGGWTVVAPTVPRVRMLAWMLELEAEWEVGDGSKCERLKAVAGEEVVVASLVRVV